MVDDFLPSKRPSSRESAKIKRDDDEEVIEFVPPEKIIEEDEVIDMGEAEKTSETPNQKPEEKNPKKGKRPNLQLKNPFPPLVAWWKKRSKKQKIIIAVAIALALALLIFGAMKIFGGNKVATPAPVAEKKEEVKEPPKPTTVASKLTGVQVPPEYNELPVTGIIIENSPDARPQSGLKDAGVVFEAVAEGGITRFLTLYQEAQPDYVGPVRSVRPYYLSWLLGFDAAVGHVGGSAEALAKIRNEGIKDLDQSFNGGAYQRVSQRYAPHNVYTSLGSLIALGKTKGFTKSEFTSLVRKEEKPPTAATVPAQSTTPQPLTPAPNSAKAIDFAVSAALYNPHFDYDLATNSYKRSQAGAPHIDERSKQQITPKVVIALVMPKGIHPDGLHTTYGTIGSGTAYVFQDGTVTIGTWEKASDKAQLIFKDGGGAALGLNPGQTWLTALGNTSSVKYTP